MKQKLVVIGAGMASGRVLEHLLEQDREAYDITLFNAEARGNYNRIMLSPVLSGEKTYADIVTHDDGWYAENDITCRFGEKVLEIDRAAKTVTGENGTVSYDKLVLGTGSNPFMIPLPGHDLDGVIAYRDLEDTERMMGLGEGSKCVVIGGGLLGLEAAAGMAARGVDVTVVHIMGHLMERQLDEAAGYLLRRALTDKGITVKCAANSKEILGENGHVRALLLDDGTELPCDLLVMAVGIRPNTKLAADSGLAVGRGIHVDDQMVTSDKDILAVGECVEHNGAIFGLVAPLYDQAKVAAATLLNEAAAFEQKELSTKLKVTGCDLFSAGDFAEGEGREDIVFRDPGRGVYRRLVVEENRIVGAVMYGDTADSNWFFGLIRDKTDIAEMRETVIFGPAYQGGAPLDPLAAVAALPPEAEICGCNGICKSKIVEAIEGGATDLGAVRAVTKASNSCGTCTGLVEQVTLGDGIWTAFRELKPGTTDAIFDGFAPLRWCTFVEPAHIYRGSSVHVEAVLSNEDVLRPGEYPATLEVFGPETTRAFRKSVTVIIPNAKDGSEPGMVIPVLSEDVVINGPPGKYRFVVKFDQGAAAAGGESVFYVSGDASMPPVNTEITLWGEDAELAQWLDEEGIGTRKFSAEPPSEREVILVGRHPEHPGGAEAFAQLARRMASGSTVVFLDQAVFDKPGQPTGWLPLANKGGIGKSLHIVYHPDQWTKRHPIFDGLPTGRIMDYTYYREIVPDPTFVGLDPPPEAVAGGITTSYGYFSGLYVAVYDFGAGRFILNTLFIREHVGEDPVAERLIRNMLRYATRDLDKPVAELPVDFDKTLDAIGYR